VSWSHIPREKKNKFEEKKRTKTIGHSIDIKLTLIVDEYLLEQLQHTSKLIVVDGKLLSQKSQKFSSNLT
jgi:hypothetical protein